MFDLSYSTPCEFQGTIRVKKIVYGLGNITDIDGKVWNIYGHFGDWVQAKPLNGVHPYWSSTAAESWNFDPTASTSGNCGMASETWKPYKLEELSDD